MQTQRLLQTQRLRLQTTTKYDELNFRLLLFIFLFLQLQHYQTTFPIHFPSHLEQVVQGVVVLVQAGLCALHSVSLVLWVWQPCCLDLSGAATHRAAAPRTTQLPARALWNAIGGDRGGGRNLSREEEGGQSLTNY